MAGAKYQIRRKCKVCGCVFEAKTIDSIYCSTKCSKIAWKRKRDEEERAKKLLDIANSVSDTRNYLTVPEAEALFEVSKDTLYRLLRTGRLHGINPGTRQTRVLREELEKLFPPRPTAIERRRPLPKRYSLEPEDCYTIGEISEKFHVNDSTVYAHIRRFSIPTRQIGNFVYVPKSEIDELYKSL